jgi:stromal membrane-associated protein
MRQPLKVVQQKLERKAELAASPPPKPQQNFDFLANDDGTSHPAAKSASAPTVRPTSTSPTKPADSLLGLDFFATAPTPSSRPSSVVLDPGKTTSSRPDLNRSILSLYAAAPRPQPKPQSPTSPTFGAPAQLAMQQPPSAFGELSDAFTGLGFSTQNSAAAAPPKPSPFANLTTGMKKSSAAPQLSAGTPGGLFSSQPTKATPAPAAGASSGFGDFFDFGAPAATPNHPSAPAQIPNANAFNALSFDTNAWVTAAPAASTASTSKSARGTSANMIPPNAWGSPPTHASIPAAQASSKNAFDDDDWGNFSSGTTSNAAPAKIPTSVGFDDDLFGNVWK